MRTIEVSVDVYAAIWAARHPGEDNEDQILRRILAVKLEVQNPTFKQMPASIWTGFKDARFNVELPEGFEIFRFYKGKEYRATATNGKLELKGTKQTYPTLNQLSRAVSGNIENAWRNWYFTGRDGQRHLIEGLRSDAKRSVRHLM
jgi:hypothetical protein